MNQTLSHLKGVRDFCKELKLPMMISLVDSTPFFFQIPENQRKAQSSTWVAYDNPKLGQVQETLVAMKGENHFSLVNTYSDINYMASYFKNPLQAQMPCTVSQLRIMINGHGEVYGGCWSMGSWGCLRKQSLREILSSEKYRQAHQAMFLSFAPVPLPHSSNSSDWRC
mgnify:CR=1 FL=1